MDDVLDFIVGYLMALIVLGLMFAWCFLVFCWLEPQTEDGQFAAVVIGIGSVVFIMNAIGYAIERKKERAVKNLLHS